MKIMEENEIIELRKKQQTKVIERWRKLGFLYGLNENSETERRAAMSYENMAVTLAALLDDDYPDDIKYKLSECTTFSFPIIRHCLTTKNRVNHVILPEQVLWPLLHLTCEELFSEVSEKNPKFKKRVNEHDKMREFLKLNDEYQDKLIDVLSRYQTKISFEEATNHEPQPCKISLDAFIKLTGIDFVACLCAMVSDYIKLKSDEFDEGLLPWDEEIPYRIDEK